MNLSSDRFDDGATLLVFAHQDDDLLWMQPFQSSAASLLLAASPPAPAHTAVVAQHPRDYRDRWHSAFDAVSTDQEWMDSFGLRDRCERDAEWSYERIRAAVEPWVARPTVSRVVTHNNWGEYGHLIIHESQPTQPHRPKLQVGQSVGETPWHKTRFSFRRA